MITSLHNSYSVIGNLSREVDSIRMRCKSVYQSMLICKDESLSSRLKNELDNLEKRKLEIHNIAANIKKISKSDQLGIEFLIELCNRPSICTSSTI